MPQLDFSIASSQIFWLIIIFFSLYTILTHSFLPRFIKILKTRKQVVLENMKLLIKLKTQFNIKQTQFITIIEKNFIKIKFLIEKEIYTLFNNYHFVDLNIVDKKVSKALYYNLVFYDINILKSVYIKPMF